ncbi:MAG: hypothetical protein GHCLOJNM_00101 [bacterium]|nr:hypothetical protein [bacterium]
MRLSTAAVLFAFLVSPPYSGAGEHPISRKVPGDIDRDGFVGEGDLIILQQNWHKGVPPPTDVITVFLPNLAPSARPLRFVRIPAGSYQMGNTGDPRDHDCGCTGCVCELPRHEVVIPHDFYLGETEVTQAQWHAVMDIDANLDFCEGNDLPMSGISWNQITEPEGFLANLDPHHAGSFRLPSESEWEYACRGPDTNAFRYEPYSFGFDPAAESRCQFGPLADGYMWWCGNNTPSGPKIVASKTSNPFGLYDIHGNLWEWCQDCWHPTYTGAPSDGSAWEDGGNAGAKRVVRGGDWFSRAWGCRSANRGSHDPDEGSPYGGVRIVLVP